MRCIKILSIALATITLLMIGYSFAESDESHTSLQEVCPVMKFGDIGCSVTKNDIYTDYKGKRIFFCSKVCRETFKKDPERYMNKSKTDGVVLMDTPEKN